MGGNKGRAGFEATVDFLCRPPPFIGTEKVKREQAGGGIERPSGRVVDIALLQLDACISCPSVRSANFSISAAGSTPTKLQQGSASANALSSRPPPAPSTNTRASGAACSLSKMAIMR